MQPYLKYLPLFQASKSISPLSMADIFKCAALFFMLMDHIGHFFLPDQHIWRVVGRWCVPIWFFYAGFYAGKKPDIRLIYYGLFLTLWKLLFYQAFFPLNILFLFYLLKTIFYRYGQRLVNEQQPNEAMFIGLALLGLPSMFLLEYGTQGLLFFMAGVMAKQGIKHDKQIAWAICSGIIYAAIQQFASGYSVAEKIFLLIGSLTLPFLMAAAHLPASPSLQREEASSLAAILKPENRLVRLLQFFARNTLDFYVVHLAIFIPAAFLLYPEKHAHFHWLQ
ncbi:MAG: TraX family protein [Alphaproteobacteria bacterium]